MESHEHDVLTAEEAAVLLRLAPDEVCRLAESGQVPGRRLGLHWRFSRQVLARHLAGQGEKRPPAEQAAEAAHRVPGDLLAQVSHEIRTPMTGILGYADLLLEEPDIERAPARWREAIRTIKRNGQHILDLINDILDLAKIDAGRLEVRRVWASPIEILESTCQLMKLRASEKGLALQIACISEVPPLVQTDPMRLRQILINLIGNAIKFTEKGAVLVLVNFEPAGERGPQLEFTVLDDGIGMTGEQLDRLFRPFVQAGADTARTHGGTGLGLAISKQLAELLGGDIAVHSWPDRGSIFRVTVAAGPVDTADLVDGDAGHLAEPAACESEPAVASNVLADCRVLLAEDTRTNQLLFTRILSAAGAAVTVADDGRRAVWLAAEALERGEPFDLILLDIHMPVLDGFEVAPVLRRAGFEGILLALTASVSEEDRDRCLAAGCDELIVKPVDRLTLLRTLRAHLDRRAALDDCARR